MKLFEFDIHIGDWRVLVQSKDIQNGAVQSRHITDDAVTSDKIGNGEVKSRNIADDAVTSDKIGDGEVKSRNIGKGAVTAEKIADQSVTGDNMPPGSLSNGKLANDAVSNRNLQKKCISIPNLGDDVTRELNKISDLQNQIDSIQIHGLAVSNEFGNDSHIGISQKTLTEAFNSIWAKLEEITGESLLGISMNVSPEYFIGENGCTAHITANTANTAGIFEHIEFYVDGELVREEENVDYLAFDVTLNHTSVIKCVAKILGVEYVMQKVVTHYNSFWLGAGRNYQSVMDVDHIIPITEGMRGNHDVEFNAGDKIFIIIGESLRGGFNRADMNGVEIQFTESTVTFGGNTYKVFTSENTYDGGTYNIDING